MPADRGGGRALRSSASGAEHGFDRARTPDAPADTLPTDGAVSRAAGRGHGLPDPGRSGCPVVHGSGGEPAGRRRFATRIQGAASWREPRAAARAACAYGSPRFSRCALAGERAARDPLARRRTDSAARGCAGLGGGRARFRGRRRAAQRGALAGPAPADPDRAGRARTGRGPAREAGSGSPVRRVPVPRRLLAERQTHLHACGRRSGRDFCRGLRRLPLPETTRRRARPAGRPARARRRGRVRRYAWTSRVGLAPARAAACGYREYRDLARAARRRDGARPGRATGRSGHRVRARRPASARRLGGARAAGQTPAPRHGRRRLRSRRRADLRRARGRHRTAARQLPQPIDRGWARCAPARRAGPRVSASGRSGRGCPALCRFGRARPALGRLLEDGPQGAAPAACRIPPAAGPVPGGLAEPPGLFTRRARATGTRSRGCSRWPHPPPARQAGGAGGRPAIRGLAGRRTIRCFPA